MSRVLHFILASACGALMVGFPARAGDILRGGTAIGTVKRTAKSGGTATGGDAAARTEANARDRLARTTQSLDAVKALQAAARAAAAGRPRLTDPNRPGKRLPLVLNGLGKGGLELAAGVPKNLKKPEKGEDPSLWIGANLPRQTTAKGGDTQVTIVQTDQQALLNWKTFNVGKKTTLTFDQSAGGADRTKWVAFNKVNDPTGRPSQILGSIKADGQVYVINQNGIIFGGTSQVNVHTLVASALPINDNLIASGLLNNPKAEFLFDARRVDSLLGRIDETTSSVTLGDIVDGSSTPVIDAVVKIAGVATSLRLKSGTDYRVAQGADRKSVVTFTPAGLEKLGTAANQQSLIVSYVALNGEVSVQPGAQLLSPTSAAKVGGRIMLVGANVDNQGTITAPDGQTILAAGLQVGIDAHKSSDPSVRGLDVYVGATFDPISQRFRSAGTATNSGLIEAARANVTITGRDVRQAGVIDSSTSVSLNGSVILAANYDAAPNASYDPSDATKGSIFSYQTTGVVTLGDGSVTRILPEIDSLETVVGTQLALRSQVAFQGEAIHLEQGAAVLAPNGTVDANAGRWVYRAADAGQPPYSKFIYNNGQIYADSGAFLDVAGTTAVATPLSQNILTLQLRGAELSDSPLQRGGVLRGPDLTVDLRESGTYNGLDWIGTPLADVRGYRDLIPHTVAELTLAGGTVNLHAGGSVVLQAGSMVDVSGGWQHYGSGFVETSLVVSGGRVIDIADATPNLVYDGLYTSQFTEVHPKWQIEKTFRNPLALNSRHFERGYIQGRNGGKIAITAPSMALDGKLAGQTTAGTRQLRNPSKKTELPVPSQLSLSFEAQDDRPYIGITDAPIFSPKPPRVIFGDILQAEVAPFGLDALGEPTALDDERRKLVVLSSDLVNEDGFGFLSINNSDGRIAVPRGVNLNFEARAFSAASTTADPTLATRANIEFKASKVDIGGVIQAPGGILNFTVYGFSPYLTDIIAADSTRLDYKTPLPDPKRGDFLLRNGGLLSTAGLLVDDRLSAARSGIEPVLLTGGSVTIQSYSAHLFNGSVIDVSGGVMVNARNAVSYGNAGSIAINAGQDPNPKLASLLGGKLILGGKLKGYSGATGGSLKIQAPLVRIGRKISNPRFFTISTGFFDQGGFSSFALTGIGSRPFRIDPLLTGDSLDPEAAFRSVVDNRAAPGLVIAEDATIDPTVQSWIARPISGEEGISLGLTVLPEGLRAPVSLSFAAKGVFDSFSATTLLFRGDLFFEKDATIDAGPRGSITLKGDAVSVLGSAHAAGGSITVTGGAKYLSRDVFPNARATVYLGPGSLLSTAGEVALVPNDFGYRTGEVLPGGRISVSGNILAEAESRLDVSGASGMLDLTPEERGLNAFLVNGASDAPVVPATSGITAPLHARVVVPTRVESDGGEIVLKGSELLVVDSILNGAAGGSTASGGSLAVSSGIFLPLNTEGTVTDVSLVVRQSGGRIPDGYFDDRRSGIGTTFRNKGGEVAPGRGYFAVDQFTAGGFGSLDLGGVVRFDGPVTINAARKISVASGGVLYADDTVRLTAPYVALGTPFLPPLSPLDPARLSVFNLGGIPLYVRPRHGDGSLIVKASLIDIGNLSLQNIGSARLIADGGDIRGDGTLNIAGSLYLRAGQIYPASGVTFTISASDYRITNTFAHGEPSVGSLRPIYTGSIVIAASGERQSPLSAGGTLNIYGSRITQGGTLRAPLGSINLGWDGSGERPANPLSGLTSTPVARRLTLTDGSEISVSAVDRGDGVPMIIPYGIVVDGGISWIDPSGVDITAGGVPAKDVRLGAKNLRTEPGSLIDIRGGGNLYAYQWIIGQGGSRDILSSTASFAVIPGYQSGFAPYAPFSTAEDATLLAGDRGFVNQSLAVGDRVYLGASSGLSAGTYTLLPARYALLPGAVLVTPKSSPPVGTVAMPDGSSLVSGYRYSALDESRPSIYTQFEVAPASVVRARAEYADYFGTRFLGQSARILGVDVPRLPIDSGHLVFQAVQSLVLRGGVNAAPPERGIGAYVDISSPGNILITGDRTSPNTPKDTLILAAADLSAFDAESLLIGGIRNSTAEGTVVDVKTGSLTVDNAGSPLVSPELILVANKSLTLAPGAEIAQAGSMRAPAEQLQLVGDGALLRVSSDPRATVVRSGLTTSTDARMTIGRGARIEGTSLVLDSSDAMTLDPRIHLLADYVSLSSGQISLRFDDRVKLQPTDGLVLSGTALRALEGVKALDLLSYSSIDIYGQGGLTIAGELAMHAGEIRGFTGGDGRVAFTADEIFLDNLSGATRPAPAGSGDGLLEFAANVIHLGRGRLDIAQYGSLELNASERVTFEKTGSLRAIGETAVTITSPAITAEGFASGRVITDGALRLLSASDPAEPPKTQGLGASLAFEGATVVADTAIYLPSGQLSLRAKNGDVTVGGLLLAGGVKNTFADYVKYTSGGRIALTADEGSVVLRKGSVLSVNAPSEGGDAGEIAISATQGRLDLGGTLLGQGGRGGHGGTFSLDVGKLAETQALNDFLNAAAFTESRSIRVREGDVLVNGSATAETFNLSADGGKITVAGLIDASGQTGGNIHLTAAGDLVLLDGSRLNAAAKTFNAAGKGGAIVLEAGAAVNGTFDSSALLDIRSGSEINLSVAANNPGSADRGRFTGTLRLRAPQNAASDDVQVDTIDGTILGASSIIVEGYKLFQLTGANAVITTAIQNAVRDNGIAFVGSLGTNDTPGTPSAGYDAMFARLLANPRNKDLATVLSIRPGAEIFNLAGDLTLGSTGSSATADWNFNTLRFGSKNVPGILTLRAAGDLVFYNALQDGFAISNKNTAYIAPLLAPNPLLPANAQSWSFHLTAGADLAAADFHYVQALSRLLALKGSVRLGKNAGFPVSPNAGNGATTAPLVNGRYQVIRTGSGDIDISAGRDVQLLNQFATIYTAGTRLSDDVATMGGNFDLPVLYQNDGTVFLGAIQENPTYPVQYTLGGGNIAIRAQGDIAHYTVDTSGNVVPDSERQLPINWLFRRGYVGANGEFGTTEIVPKKSITVSSTTWWVDFANFFEGIGALGGGNVSLIAGGNISNVDAVIPTNARMPKGVPNADKLVELGGGDLVVSAGRDIDAGVYYVERGQGVLKAGKRITTNATRSPSRGVLNNEGPMAEATWLPTTLFLGKGSFDVTARGDVLLGPVVNPFLLPSGYSNTFYYKSYFSTYAESNEVNVTSLGGNVTLRDSAVPSSSGLGTPVPILQLWLENVSLLTDTSVSSLQPWLRLNETSVQAFRTTVALSPPTLRVTAISGDINLVGDLTLVPAPKGSLELVAGGSINGLQLQGATLVNGILTNAWGSSHINLSDAAPGVLPGVANPFAFQNVVDSAARARQSTDTFLDFLNGFFIETGSTTSVSQTKQALHAQGLLHADDPDPVRLYALNGDVSGLTLFAGKKTEVFAARDITDIALYIQQVSADDVSLISAGRDIVASNGNSALRAIAAAPGNSPNQNEGPLPGDIQISGPGALEVLAGRNLDLGTGSNNADGTGAGIVSIGNARNPYLPFEGADVIIGAGVGPSLGLTRSRIDFQSFATEIVKTDGGAEAFVEALGDHVDFASGESLEEILEALSPDQQARVLLSSFYLMLRDAGRNFERDGNYDAGFAAIDALFGDGKWRGDVLARGRDIRTKNGGDINILAPGGELRLASTLIGNPFAPPGIITETGGDIAIFTDKDVDIGVGRIFTLRGGDEIIWSSTGDIAAGSAAKTVASAPPTRVLIDPQSADLATDLAGLSTGGGIGVLATVAGVPPGNVDLIAPFGIVDAGDAGIRATGTVNIAATAVLNAGNITAAGGIKGVPSAPVAAAPNIAGLTAASTTAGATNSAANDLASQARQQGAMDEATSEITVTVVGYGGGEIDDNRDDDDDEEGDNQSTSAVESDHAGA